LNSKIFLSDKASNFKGKIIIGGINEEIKIRGNWYIKLYEPSSKYILCIVLSVKKSALTVKNNTI